ncbi:FG-GAP-like repeat-containing protein [Paenibacillus sp. RC67]|uniref:FG-GAP-like repeat-containing protein n=1 Tax=Paenibacillus sp. RC67 TaxID=3039392 RepID=UPI0024ACB946|nr:FG-GAP-like repeat-containing protein [Paenibacillus sp. RC67]
MRAVNADLFLLSELDISAAGPRCKMLLGDLDGDGRMEIVMVQPDHRQDVRYIPHQVQCITVFDLQGKLLWQTGTPDTEAGGPGSDYPAQIYDLDGDGHLEVLCVMNGRFHILDGQTGKVKRSFELPDPQAHDCIMIANLTGGKRPSDLILKDRYHRMWALNSEFELLWTHTGNPGHFPWPVDLDGDGYDEVMAGYDLLDHQGKLLWSCRDLDDHADCIWVGDVNDDGQPELVIGGSVTVMYDSRGQELWRYDGSIESQHVALGKFRNDLPGLQVAGLDRIVRGDGAGKRKGKDGMFLLDAEGQEVWKEDRKTDGWLTIIETVSRWDDSRLDYILAYRRGGGVLPALYDGHMNIVVQFPTDGYVTHADLLGSSNEQIVIYDNDKASIYSKGNYDVAVSASGHALPQSKRLYHSTLYPGGEI